MSETDWRAREDCGLVRSGGQVKIFDADGYLLFVLPDSWSDDDAWVCFQIANKAHREGVERGKFQIQSAIKNLLDINSNIGFEIQAHERREHGIRQGE